MIYDSNGVALRADQIADAVKNWPQLYSDDGQTTPATRANLLSELDDARTTSAATVQALIDADEKLSALAEPPVASADAVDHEWVVVTFPTDATAPKFWSGVAGEIVAYGGQYTAAPYAVRQSVQKWRSHFDKISALL
tara:strand:- start:73 stop:486 length:414 start_codon:yes stop_codon:yes gene_type:complete